MKGLYKTLKHLAVSLAILTLIISAYILLSGNTYMFFMLKNTVFKGRLGPNISESGIYANRMVQNGKIEAWPERRISVNFTEEEMQFHLDYGTAGYVVIYRDTLVFEYYGPNYSDSSHTNTWSVSKSITGLLTGIAIDEGLIPNSETLIEEYFPKYKASGIRLKHLLSMSSGINYDEHYINPWAYPARALYGDDLSALNSRYQPEKPPGERFDYQSGNTQLLSMLIHKVSGKTLSEYASEKLWKPLGAEHPAYWSLDRDEGMEKAFCCFNSNARDLARIGKLLLHQGIWNGDTLISTHYLKEALRPADIKTENGQVNQKYGYHWWLLNLPEYKGYYARGIQGQYIAIIPNEELVVVRLGERRPTEEREGHITDILKYIDMARRIKSFE